MNLFPAAATNEGRKPFFGETTMKLAIAAVILGLLALAQVKAEQRWLDTCGATDSCIVGP